MQKHFGPEAESVAKTAGQRLIQQGRQQERQAAQQQGQGRLLRQLHLRFGELSPEVVARIQRADDVALDRLSERIITAKTLNDVFDDA